MGQSFKCRSFSHYRHHHLSLPLPPSLPITPSPSLHPQMFNRLGVHVHHEGLGPHGAVSWFFAYKSNSYAINNPDSLSVHHFCFVFHQVGSVGSVGRWVVREIVPSVVFFPPFPYPNCNPCPNPRFGTRCELSHRWSRLRRSHGTPTGHGLLKWSPESAREQAERSVRSCRCCYARLGYGCIGMSTLKRTLIYASRCAVWCVVCGVWCVVCGV